VLKPTEVYFGLFKRMQRHNVKLKNVVDCGAFEGKWSERLKEIYPDVNLHLIDASDRHKEKLEKLGTFHKAVLADKTEWRTFYSSKSEVDFSGNSLYEENSNHPFEDSQVYTTTLQEVLPEETTWDYIKMDLQGAEIEVIDGSLELFQKTKFVQLECPVFHNNVGAPRFEQIINYMANSGFRAWDMENCYLNNRLMGLDIVFTNINLPHYSDLEATFLKYS